MDALHAQPLQVQVYPGEMETKKKLHIRQNTRNECSLLSYTGHIPV